MYQWENGLAIFGENLQCIRRRVEFLNIRKGSKQCFEICRALTKTTASEDEIEIEMRDALHIAG